MVESAVTAAPTESVADASTGQPGRAPGRAVRRRRGHRRPRRSDPRSAVPDDGRGASRCPAPPRRRGSRRVWGPRCPPPVASVTTGDGVSVLWLSPDEFLVVGDEQPAQLTSRLVEALGDEPGSVIDLSANRTTFELAGPSARAVLEKGCPLDLHPRTFEVGTAYLTLIGSVPVVLWKVADEPYRILPRSSFADFLGRWLLDAMAEFKAPELPMAASGAV